MEDVPDLPVEQPRRKSLFDKLSEEGEAGPGGGGGGKRVGFYKIMNQVGSGNFSKVKLSVHLLTQEKVAAKIIDRSHLDNKSRRVLSNEIKCLERLYHPNIIRLFEIIESYSHLYLFMEYAGEGDVEERVRKEGRFTEREGKKIFQQISSAVNYMHQHDVIHRDLKAENVFFCSRHQIKVGDFGFATLAPPGGGFLETFCGSPPYSAPELFEGDRYEGTKVDVWALGVLLYFMLTGSMPFAGDGVLAIKSKVQNCNYEVPSHLSENCLELLRGILKVDPSLRYSTKDITNSRWVSSKAVDLSTSDIQIIDMTDEDGDGPGGVVGRGHAPSEPPDEEVLEMMKNEYGVPVDDCVGDMRSEPRNSTAGTYRILLHRKASQGEPKLPEGWEGSPPESRRGKRHSVPFDFSFDNRKKSLGGQRHRRNRPSKACVVL